ncbi:MAG: transglutaminase domain-containing protein [Myxococcales bacterium]|nr:transglutaminase domain-containing protein [Myxococcales bacterium]
MGLPERRRFRFTFEIALPPSREPSFVWVPRPIENDWQRELAAAFPSLPRELGEDPLTGNRIARFALPASAGEQSLEVSFDVERRLRQRAPPQPARFATPPRSNPKLARYLEPSSKVPLDGVIGDQAASFASPEQPPVVIARRAFDYLLETLSYDSGGCTPERADELGNLQVACDLKTGTCTEFHGLFVRYMRALGVPARFNFGFNVPSQRDGRIKGYHCWAELALPDGTWLPVDVSEAWKRRAGQAPEEEVSFYFGSLDPNRVAFTWDRDVDLVPRQRGGRIDKFIFPYAESGAAAVTPKLGFRFVEL